MAKITISMPNWLLAIVENSRLETSARTGYTGSRSQYIRWLIHHGIGEADKLNDKEKKK